MVDNKTSPSMPSSSSSPGNGDILEIRDGAEDSNYRKLGTDMQYQFRNRGITNFLVIFATHIWALYGVYACLHHAKYYTILWATFIGVAANQAVVMGAHRAFSHGSFKPTKPLKLALVFFQTMAGQNSVYWWARDHRLHHKFTDTDADPYNSSRGFFFSHMRWYLVYKHPLVLEKGNTIDVADLKADKLLMFQHKYFSLLHVVIGILFPVLVPICVWNEDPWTSFCIAYCLQLVLDLHSISSINSFAHMYGERPFDKRINPVQSRLVHWVTGGDGWHNFHHCFPWDYGMSEFGYGKGLSTRLIELFAYLGLAYDLKKASARVVNNHLKRHGDGSLIH